MLDADGSTDPAEIPRFVAALVDGRRLRQGLRFPRAAAATTSPAAPHGQRVPHRLVNLLFGTRYTDLCYGYNAFWRHRLTSLNLDSTGFEVETLLNIRAVKVGLTVCEVPSVEQPASTVRATSTRCVTACGCCARSCGSA